MTNMVKLRELIEKINMESGINVLVRYDEPLAEHTSFKVGGPADVWIKPEGEQILQYLELLLSTARSRGIPVFILGGGANIVPSDEGVRGIVLDMTSWTGCAFYDNSVEIRSGTRVDDAVRACADQGRSSLEFLAGMPGTIGGAVWMNARCYGLSISDVLMETHILDETYKELVVPFKASDFSYKRSPFQTRAVLISSARFRTKKADAQEMRRRMESYRKDRESKGHYRLPSAGSVFKNNPSFGKPTGQIVDELGLRGLQIGGARVADWHGNIIVNTGNATASDIRALTEELVRRVKAERGISLECEILFIGQWGNSPL